MNAQCYSPIFSHSETLARFTLKSKDAVAWLAAHRERSAPAFRQLLARCPESLLLALCSSLALHARSHGPLDEVSLDALTALLESPNCSIKGDSANQATKIFDIEIDLTKRKSFLGRLKKIDADSIDDSIAAELSTLLVGLLDATQLSENIQLPKLSAETWKALAIAGQQEKSLVFDLTNWLASEADFQKRLHEEKMASMKQLAYGASHEINNPLANIASRAQTLMMDETDPERKMRLAKINQQAFRAHEMIADMMLFAHPPQLELAEFDIASTIQEVLGELQETADQQETSLVFEGEVERGVSQIYADPSQVAVAVRALLLNSLEALQQSGRVTIAVTKAEQCCEITVTDDGPGISESAVRHLFDPFYSGREAGRGLGFGLSKVWRIAELHGGEVSTASLADGETQFRLRIPSRCSIKSSP